MKGADVVMCEYLKSVYKSVASDDCDNLAREGLRTLIIAQKIVDESYY